jgi:hypothetical protein
VKVPRSTFTILSCKSIRAHVSSLSKLFPRMSCMKDGADQALRTLVSAFVVPSSTQSPESVRLFPNCPSRKVDALADKLTRLVIPALPALKPHANMLHHLRFILPLLPSDSSGVSPLHRYDAAIQRARNHSREPTEKEFELGMEAALAIVGV